MAGNLVSDGDTPAWEREHHRLRVAQVFEPCGEGPTGIGAIAEPSWSTVSRVHHHSKPGIPTLRPMLITAGHATFDVDGVVFDKDGTLISLDSYWLEPSRIWIEVAAGGSTELERVLSRTLGLTSDNERLVADGPLATATLDALVSLTRGLLEAEGVESVAADRMARSARERAVTLSATLSPTPIGDVRGTFERLSAAGLRLAIATTDDAAPTVDALHALGIAGLVDIVVAADGDVPAKPHPEVLGSIARGLQTTPDRLLMVGDSQRDADTARAGGAAGFVLVSPDRFPRITADATIASVENLRVPHP